MSFAQIVENEELFIRGELFSYEDCILGCGTIADITLENNILSFKMANWYRRIDNEWKRSNDPHRDVIGVNTEYYSAKQRDDNCVVYSVPSVGSFAVFPRNHDPDVNDAIAVFASL